jgi:hypothetical protein
MKKPVIVTLVVILVSGSALFLNQTRSENTNNTTLQLSPTEVQKITPVDNKVDYKASFAIFTNGTFRIFSDQKYHNQSEDVLIQADNPNLIGIKKSGVTWDDFFRTLPFKLAKDCLTTGTGQTFCTNANGRLRFFINGREDANALDKIIGKGDKLLVTYGNEKEQQIKEQLQQIPDVR